MWGFLGRSPDSGSHPWNLDRDESGPAILSRPGRKQVPRGPLRTQMGQRNERRTGGKKGTREGQTDGEGERGERERGHSQISVPPAARVPLRCGGKCPRAAESGQDPRPRPPDPVRPPAPRSRPGRTAAFQASCRSHLLACSGGLRRATVRTTGPGARSGFPEVSEHALGWLLCGVRVGG